MWALLFTVSTDVVMSLVRSLLQAQGCQLAIQPAATMEPGPQDHTSTLGLPSPGAPPYSRCFSWGSHPVKDVWS